MEKGLQRNNIEKHQGYYTGKKSKRNSIRDMVNTYLITVHIISFEILIVNKT